MLLATLLLSLNVFAINDEYQNDFDNTKTINNQGTQSQSKKYVTYSLTDSKGIKWEFQQTEKFNFNRGNGNKSYTWKIFRNGKFIAAGTSWWSNKLAEHCVDFDKVLTERGMYVEMFFPRDKGWRFGSGETLYFGKDGYAYPSSEYLSNETPAWRIKYTKKVR